MSVMISREKEKYSGIGWSAVFTFLLVLSFLPMGFSWFGGARGVQEIPGTVELTRPAVWIGTGLALLAIWLPLWKRRARQVRFYLGFGGLLLLPFQYLYDFYTWQRQSVSPHISLLSAFSGAYVGFYIGFGASVLLLLAYIFLCKANHLHGWESP